jgi:hypothetical protein
LLPVFQAAVEHTLLRETQESVERLFVNGLPPHHQESSRSLNLLPGASKFFVTTPEDFVKMKPKEVQDIFRHRHILVPGTPPSDFQFDRAGLGQLGSLDDFREIQGLLFIFVPIHFLICNAQLVLSGPLMPLATCCISVPWQIYWPWMGMANVGY